MGTPTQKGFWFKEWARTVLPAARCDRVTGGGEDRLLWHHTGLISQLTSAIYFLRGGILDSNVASLSLISSSVKWE